MIKNGMTVTYSEKNVHSSGNQTAYGGITGVVTDLGEDNSFVIKAEGCTLIVPMRNYFGRTKGVWLTIEGKEVFIPSKETAYEKKMKIENSLFNRILRLLKLFSPSFA
jgi:hypothetical protein